MTTPPPGEPEPRERDATAVLPPPPGGSEPETEAPPSRRDRRGRAQRLLIEWTLLIAAAVLIAVVIRLFLFQAFYIPSPSMEPTLNISDRVLVNKLSYDFHDVNRGDIVVFEAPECARDGDIKDLVKRVIGLPGETITADANGSVLVDGRRLDEPYLRNGTATTFSGVPPEESSACASTPGHERCGQPAGGGDGCVVPPGTVFVLGDNRTRSRDGRVFGPIDQDLIVGRVFIRIWPIDDIGFL